VKPQAETGKPLGQSLHHTSGIVLDLKGHDEVIGIADEAGAASQTRADLLLEPGIQHFVEVEVGQERGDDPSLRGAGLRVAPPALFHHPGVEPLVDRAAQHSIPYPSVQKAP
jgi:hypothetical protein